MLAPEERMSKVEQATKARDRLYDSLLVDLEQLHESADIHKLCLEASRELGQETIEVFFDEDFKFCVEISLKQASESLEVRFIHNAKDIELVEWLDNLVQYHKKKTTGTIPALEMIGYQLRTAFEQKAGAVLNSINGKE